MPTGSRVGVRRELMLLYGAAAIALLMVAFGAVVATRSVARNNALADAERQTGRLADLVIGPHLVGALKGDADAAKELNRDVTSRLRDGYLTEITVWAADGTIVYSDRADQIGRKLPPPPEVTAAINGVVTSDFEEEPEVEPGAAAEGDDKFVEVYVPFDVAGQPRMAFEAYYDYARVDEVARSLLWRIIPLVLVPLLVLQFFQIPIAVSLARRVRKHEAERSRLLEMMLSASKKERITIASDLHDGPIQDLAGISYALGAVAPTVPTQHQPLMRNVQDTVLHAIESLRRLMIQLYPPDLSTKQLPESLDHLAVPLREQGVQVSVHVDSLPEMSRDNVTTIYRVARETLANVVKHAGAKNVEINLGVDLTPGTKSGPQVRLSIVDDGIGLNPAKLNRRAEGHLGLKLLIDRVENLGGTMQVISEANAGTEIRVTLPLMESKSSGYADDELRALSAV
jgi:two-component system NarL family sensor kinase